MTEQVVVAPLLVALVTALLTLVLRGRAQAQAAFSLLGGGAYVLSVAALVARVADGTTLTYQVGDWPAPFGISLVGDPLSGFMLALAAVVALAALVFSVRYVDGFGQRLSYHPLYHLMLVGVTGAFLTGDVFNLFVWFEVMLLSSYVLVVFYSGPEHTRAALQYAVANLVGSAVMLLAIGGLYATLGTLNMADVARRLAAAEQYGVDPAPVLGLSALLFAVFALKAGVVPFHFWVPAAYRAAPAPVAAMLAGVVKKVGVYAVIRLYFTVFAVAPLDLDLPGIAGGSPFGYYGPVVFLMALASVLFGGLAAVDRDRLEGVLAYSSVGQVGFILLPLAVGATAGGAVRTLAVAAALVYSLNHALAKGLLFLAAGAVQDATSTTRLGNLGGLASGAPVLSGATFVGLLALVGVPPLSGFFGKLFVLDVAARVPSWPAVAVALAGALLTIAYATRVWNRGFWGQQSPLVDRATPDPLLVGVLGALALAIVAVGVGFDPVYRLAETASHAATDTGAYVEAVLGPEAWPATGPETGAGGTGGTGGGHS